MADIKAFLKKRKKPFYQSGGTMLPNLDSYIERQADEDLYEALTQGKFCYLLTSRQLGKSSLAARVVDRLEGEGTAVATLELTSIGTQETTPERWYFGFLRRIGEGVNLTREVEAFWVANERFPPLQRCMQAIREVILESIKDRPVVIVIDEIEYTRSLPFNTDDLFAAIREMYNRRAFDPEMNRLTFCLVGSVSPSDLIKNAQITPFNVGQRIRLDDFTRSDIAQLAMGMGRDDNLAQALLDRIFYWTDGHPYLTHKLCESVSVDRSVIDAPDVDRICKKLFFSHSDVNNNDAIDGNIRFVRDRMLAEDDRAGLLAIYAKVHKGKKVLNEANPLFDVLRLAGIVKVEKGYLRVRNRIYEGVFNQAWIKESMPDAELRRLRAATLRAWRNAAMIIAAIAVALIFAVVQRAEAINQKKEAVKQTQLAEASAKQARESAEEAKKQQAIAEKNAGVAEYQRGLAQASAEEAEKQRAIAQEKAAEAEEQKSLAQSRAQELEVKNSELNEKSQELKNQNRIANLLQLEAISNQKKAESQQAIAEKKTKEVEEEKKKTEARSLANLAAFSVDSGTASKYSSVDSLIAAVDYYYASEAKHEISSEVLDSLKKSLVTSQIKSIIPEDSVADVVFKDGKADEVRTVSTDGKAALWNITNPSIPTGGEKLTLRNETNDYISSVTLSPDGNLVALGTDKGAVSYYNLNSSDPTTPHKTRKHRHTINRLAFSNSPTDDGKGFPRFLGSSSQLWISGNTTLLSDKGDLRAKPKALWRKPGILSWLGMIYGTRNNRLITGLSFSDDGKLMATGRQDGTVEIREAMHGDAIFKLLGKREADRLKIDITAQYKKNPAQLNTQIQRQLGGITDGHSDAVLDIAFSPDTKRVVTVSRDKTVKVWDISQFLTNNHTSMSKAIPECTLLGHGDVVLSAALDGDGNRLATSSQDRTAIIWDMTSKLCKGDAKLDAVKDRSIVLATLSPHEGYVNTVAFSHDGKSLATASNRIVKIWDVSDAEKLKALSDVLARIDEKSKRLKSDPASESSDVEELLKDATKVIPRDVIELRCKANPARVACEKVLDWIAKPK